MLSYPDSDCVHRIHRCKITAHDRRWAFEKDHVSDIDACWQSAVAANPRYFNGIIYLVDDLKITGGGLSARLLATDFKCYLYWRQQGFPPSGVRDGFGSALVRSADGAVVVGRQRAGNVNGGLAYLPGGFIDARDVTDDGHVDIAASITRELEEETGLTLGDVVAEPGYLVTEAGAHLSIAKPFRSHLEAGALKRKIERHLAADRASELEEIIVLRSAGDIEGLAMPHYARVLATTLFAGPAF